MWVNSLRNVPKPLFSSVPCYITKAKKALVRGGPRSLDFDFTSCPFLYVTDAPILLRTQCSILLSRAVGARGSKSWRRRSDREIACAPTSTEQPKDRSRRYF